MSLRSIRIKMSFFPAVSPFYSAGAWWVLNISGGGGGGFCRQEKKIWADYFPIKTEQSTYWGVVWKIRFVFKFPTSFPNSSIKILKFFFPLITLLLCWNPSSKDILLATLTSTFHIYCRILCQTRSYSFLGNPSYYFLSNKNLLFQSRLLAFSNLFIEPA